MSYRAPVTEYQFLFEPHMVLLITQNKHQELDDLKLLSRLVHLLKLLLFLPN